MNQIFISQLLQKFGREQSSALTLDYWRQVNRFLNSLEKPEWGIEALEFKNNLRILLIEQDSVELLKAQWNSTVNRLAGRSILDIKENLIMTVNPLPLQQPQSGQRLPFRGEEIRRGRFLIKAISSGTPI